MTVAPVPEAAMANPFHMRDPPCVRVELDIEDAAGAVRQDILLPDPCRGGAEVAIRASTDAVESVGRVTFEQPVMIAVAPAHPLRDLVDLAPAGRAAAQGPLPAAVQLEVAWHLSYGSHCRDVRAQLAARLNGAALPAFDPAPALAPALCAVLTGQAPLDGATATATALAGLAWHLAHGALAGAATNPLEPLLESLALAYGPFPLPAGAPAPPPPSAPAGLAGRQDGAAQAGADALAPAAQAQLAVQDDGPLGAHDLHAAATVGAGSGAGGGAGGLPLAVLTPGPAGRPASAAAPERAEAGSARPAPLDEPLAPHAASGAPVVPAEAPPLHAAAALAPGPAPLGPALAALAAGAAGVVAAVWLFHRIARPLVLQHPKRAALYAALAEAQRSATPSELASRTGMDRKTAEYHLTYIARHGLLREEGGDAGPRRFAVPGTPPEPGLADRILAAVAAAPGCTAAELTRALGDRPWSVDRGLKELLAAGRLASRVAGGTRRLYPATEA